MVVVNLPLNNSGTFSNNYITYVNVYTNQGGALIVGFPTELSNPDGTGIKAILQISNTIQFSPFTLADSGSFWFRQINGLYVPLRWVENNLYQERNYDTRGNFTFQGNINTNTLHTIYGTNYTVSVFIKALDSNYQPIVMTSVPITSGNFNLTLDTTNVSNIFLLQWGFAMQGYPVYVTETNNQGSINITGLPVITFPDIDATYGDSPINPIVYTSNSDGAVTYTSSNTLVATISGSTITFVGVGPSTITATQAATDGYASATTQAACSVYANTPSTPVIITNREELEYFLSTDATYGEIVNNITITSALLANSNKVLTSTTNRKITMAE
jgi:hypothetical protein